VFSNLFSGVGPRFYDHNFSNFIDRIEQHSCDDLRALLSDSWGPWGRESRFDPNFFGNIVFVTLSPETCASFFRAYPNLPVTERDYYLSKLFQFIWLIATNWIDHRGDAKDRYSYGIEETLEGSIALVPDSMIPVLRDFNWGRFQGDLEDGDRSESSIETSKKLLAHLSGYLTTEDIDREAVRPDDVGVLSAKRKLLLEQFTNRGGKAVTVYEAVGVHRSDFYRWKRGQLPEQSAMTRRIEDFIKRALDKPLVWKP
jgi:hypothetical protein